MRLRGLVFGLLLLVQPLISEAAGRKVLHAPSHLLRSQSGAPDLPASADAHFRPPVPLPRHSKDPTQSTLPVLAFPEPGMDDTAAYQGYQTRFYRDSKQNTLQIYLQPQGGRVVAVWADAANESAGFTARDAAGHPARLRWDGEEANVSDSEPVRAGGGMRSLEYRIVADVFRLELGWFVLGSMRVERDFVYSKRHLKPFTAPPFVVAEESLLVANVARLPAGELQRHLALLGATLEQLRSRLQPTVSLSRADTLWSIRIERPSLDGRNRLSLQLGVDSRKVKVRVRGGTVSLQTSPGSPIRLTVRVATDAAPLTPLPRSEIFNRAFLEFLSAARSAPDSMRFRRLEREVRGVELLSTKEKLMAGLPNFATYFGRDMMMTALMMRPIWSPAMAEHVIASVLRKLGPRGDVSHEEALGGQAIRESAVEYDSLLTEYFRLTRARRQEAASAALTGAGDILRDLQKTRENYHMIDDEFQLPVLAARYLEDPSLPAERKRGFLLDSADGGTSRLALLLREMALVASKTRPYVENPKAVNLVGFPKRDSTHWRSASWRDSDAGYAGGRFAMDINAIWVPQALDAISTILATLPAIGVRGPTLDSIAPEIRHTPLAEYAGDPASLRRALGTWRGARRHFEIALGAREIQQRIKAKLAWLPQAERRFWQKAMSEHGGGRDSLAFLVLSLDAQGTPIPVVNTDPATGLFLAGLTARAEARTTGSDVVLRDAGVFVRPYPVGLLVESLGPLVANDAYASREIWERFRADPYHGPRVVWGREVNLLFLGLASEISRATNTDGQPKHPGDERYVGALRNALERTLEAVNASGLKHNELWSYRVEGGRLVPTRYGTSSDVQLWNGTDLAVQFALSRLPRPMSTGGNMLTAEERAAGWRQLFDGTTTTAWRGYRKDALPQGWQVVDGALTRVGPGGDIVTKGEYGNFELALEWRVDKGGNSGIFYRVSEDGEYAWESGSEMQVLDDAAHPDGRSPLTSAGALYAIYPAPRGAVRPAGEWNAVRIVLNGSHVEHWLNGVKVVDGELGSPDWEARVKQSKFSTMPRYGRNQSGHIGLQDHGDRVAFRNIKIRVLP